MRKVYFFATCLGSAAMQESVLNAIKLLRREGVEVIFKKNQTCCSQPSFNSGYFDESRAVAMHNINLFDENIPILVPSGSCAGMMGHDYLQLFEGSAEFDKVQQFAARVYDLSQYLDEIIKVNYQDKGEKIKVAWHSNCHALRVAKSVEASKNLIRKLENVELIELEHEEECCGFGGTFAVKESEISNAMALAKIEDIKKTGASYIISGDGGCLLNISGTMKRNGVDIKCLHLYDFLIKRLEGVAL